MFMSTGNDGSMSNTTANGLIGGVKTESIDVMLEAPKSNCNLIVNYLPQSLKESDLTTLFSKFGQLKTCKLMFDRQTGYSFGYGFVEFVNEEDAKRAIENLNGYQIEHKRLRVALARPNCEDTKNTNLYIRNIPMNFEESQLTNLFSQYGEVVQVRILRDQNTNFSRRIGFVIMATKNMAQTAIQNLDNTVPAIGGATEPIFVKFADEDGKKRMRVGNNNRNMNNSQFDQMLNRGHNQHHNNMNQGHMMQNHFNQNHNQHGHGQYNQQIHHQNGRQFANSMGSSFGQQQQNFIPPLNNSNLLASFQNQQQNFVPSLNGNNSISAPFNQHQQQNFEF